MTRLLIRNAGHEVRTPLSSIINYLEVALEESLDERARLHLQRSLQASKSLVSVVNDLLNLTEVEGKVDFRIHETDVELNTTIAEVVVAFKDEAARKNLNIQVERDPTTPDTVRCDPNGIRQVLSNLLANAVQNSDNSYIYISMDHIKSTEANSWIKITFRDEGKGLLEHELDSIFQDFEQILDDEEVLNQVGEEKSKSKPLEIGLGLATAARFVRVNFGQIKISSEGQGKGVTVSITMPFRKALDDPSPRRGLSTNASLSLPTPLLDTLPRSPRTPPSTTGSMLKSETLETTSPTASTPDSSMDRYPFPTVASTREEKALNVLVAEDNPLNSRLLDTRLKRRGHSVQIAADGTACLTLFQNSSEVFDIILMDIQVGQNFHA